MSETKPREKGALTISLLGREFRVACPEGEEKQLLASVDYLNRKLREVRDTGKVVGNERIAIMAALTSRTSSCPTVRMRTGSTRAHSAVESKRCRKPWIRRSPPTRKISSEAAARPLHGEAGFPAVFVRAYIL